MKVAFLGLGNMGAPMAANLVQAGVDLTGFDPVPAAVADATARGVTVVGAAAAAATGADVVITMLPGGEHLLACYREILPVVAPGALLVDCSTVDVESARAAAALAEEAGHRAVDAPVSGGTAGAQGGTLTFMVGGPDGAVADVRPLLEHMGARVIHCGGTGAGQVAKMCNNMVLGTSMVAVAEAFVLGERLGLDHQALFDVMSTSSGQCWSLTTYCPVPGPVPASPANRDYAPGFMTALMVKDLRLAAAAAGTSGADTALGRHTLAMYEAMLEQDGGGTRDFSAVIEDVRARSATS